MSSEADWSGRLVKLHLPPNVRGRDTDLGGPGHPSSLLWMVMDGPQRGRGSCACVSVYARRGNNTGFFFSSMLMKCGYIIVHTYDNFFK